MDKQFLKNKIKKVNFVIWLDVFLSVNSGLINWSVPKIKNKNKKKYKSLIY